MIHQTWETLLKLWWRGVPGNSRVEARTIVKRPVGGSMKGSVSRTVGCEGVCERNCGVWGDQWGGLWAELCPQGPIISLSQHPLLTQPLALPDQLHCLALLILTHPLPLPAFSLTSTYTAWTFSHVHLHCLHIHLHSPTSLTHSLTPPKLKPKNLSFLTLSSYRFFTPFPTDIIMFTVLSAYSDIYAGLPPVVTHGCSTAGKRYDHPSKVSFTSPSPRCRA